MPVPDTLDGVRIILVDDHNRRAAATESQLAALGCKVLAVIPTGAGLLRQMSQHEPDVIIIALDSPDRDVLESLSVVASHNPRPVAMFSGKGNSSFINEAIRSGVSAYQTQDISPELVEAAIRVAIAQFDAFTSLKLELVETQQKLDERKWIERAKGLLMERGEVSEREAFTVLRKAAMDRNCTLAEASKAYLELLERQQTGD